MTTIPRITIITGDNNSYFSNNPNIINVLPNHKTKKKCLLCKLSKACKGPGVGIGSQRGLGSSQGDSGDFQVVPGSSQGEDGAGSSKVGL